MLQLSVEYECADLHRVLWLVGCLDLSPQHSRKRKGVRLMDTATLAIVTVLGLMVLIVVGLVVDRYREKHAHHHR